VADPTTPNMGLTQPAIGGDVGLWGAYWNNNAFIIDQSGAVQSLKVSANFNAVPGIAFETIIYVVTGSGSINIGIPVPSTCPGKVFTIKKVDGGIGQVVVAPASGIIDGLASYVLSNQYGYVRLHCDGTTYNVIGNG
jgi:hypothetical protein